MRTRHAASHRGADGRSGGAGARRSRRGERGSELVELAMVLPLLMVLIVGVIEYAFLFQSYEVVANAAREGARVAVLPGYATADIQNRVAAFVTASGLPATPTTTPTRIAPSGVDLNAAVRVQVQYVHQLQFLGPMLTLVGGSMVSSLTVSATSTMRCEVRMVGQPFCTP